MNDVLLSVKRILDDNECLVLATILEKSAAAPRSEGTKMIIKQDLTIEGSIGGGLIEAMIIKSAAKVFKEKKFRVENFLLSSKEVVSLGTAGGGNLKILLEYVNYRDRIFEDFYGELISYREKKTDFVIITKIPEAGGESLEKWICTETALFGSESEELLSLIKDIRENFSTMKYREAYLQDETYFVELFFTNENVLIIGAGHIGKVLADFCKILGFYVVVVDDREEFANIQRFKTADEVIVIDSFERVIDQVKIDQHSFVVIVTRGHVYDKDVLAQMLSTDAQYIGMIGSRSKRNQAYQSLLEEGFTYKDLERVYSPIGLPIHGETPEELAVSIAAEMIQVRRAPKR
ncbi:molybdenum dehydrogenase [Acetobacterium paludosum]|uniref:Molybdenum dehydrogenase n=1 Tax=Acetobacterium paludosum TaxID=52693 RepID=A0A923KVN7_9FIRM|nr:XdhC/CoxI family protein [Acetobacterium paludosum]MBC3887193.1 molybdenum dehydrogenase [Acetobacterium paludosum]